MTLNRARKLLGKLSEKYTDDQLSLLIVQMKDIASACIEKMDTEMNWKWNRVISLKNKVE